MTAKSKINRGSEIRAKGKSMGRERSGDATAGVAPSLIARLRSRATWYLVGRVALMLAGIAVMAFGIDVVVRSHLGNSPISACPNVLSLAFPQVSFGAFMMAWQCFLVTAQIVILRRDFRLVNLLQIPVSVFFSFCIDAFGTLLGDLAPAGYLTSWLWLACGMAILAAGVVMTVVSGTVMNCGEAVVQAVVDKSGARFGTVKVGFDLTCAVLAIVCSFAFMGHLAGVREGTIVSAAFTGVIVNAYMGLYGRLRGRIRTRRAARRRKQRASEPARMPEWSAERAAK